MGQLEKYGLYVLCLVIFLILGVAIWGEPTPSHASGPATGVVGLDLSEPGKKDNLPLKEIVASDELIHDIFNSSGGGSGDKSKTKAKGNDDKSKTQTKPEAAKTDAKDKPAVDPKPASPATGDDKRWTYTVKDGDLLGTIAQKQLGSTRYVDEIQKLNPGLDPRRIHEGDKLVMPSKAELGAGGGAKAASPHADAKAVAGTKSYTVRDGDTYEAIAVKLFKSKARVDDIAKLNPGLDPRKLHPGKDIVVPVE